MKNSEPVAASVPGRPGSASSGKMAGSFEESLPHLVWTAQPDGWVDFFNQKWFDYTGQKFQESAGWGWKEAVHWKEKKKGGAPLKPDNSNALLVLCPPPLKKIPKPKFRDFIKRVCM